MYGGCYLRSSDCHILLDWHCYSVYHCQSTLTWETNGVCHDLNVHARHLSKNVLNTNCTGHFFYEDPFDSQGDSQPSWEWNCEMWPRGVHVERHWWLRRAWMAPDDFSTDYRFPVFVVDENSTVYWHWKARDDVLNRPTADVCVHLTPKVVIDVSMFSWFEFIDWYQLITVMPEHLIHLKILGSTLFDDI